MKKSSLIFFGLTVALLSSGCASFRVKTDLLPESDTKLKSTAGMFYIAGLKYSWDDELVTDRRQEQYLKAHYDDYGNNLLRMLRKECSARYPLLFTQEPYSAIPLFVTINDKRDNNDLKTITWMFCTVLIVGGIFPVPVENDRDLTVSASIWNGVDGQGSAAVQKTFRREERGWFTAFTPLGLIPIPGESDFPKKSLASIKEPIYDVPQIAQQVATALAKMIESKEPDFWKAAQLRTQQPGYAPTTPVITPPILPPPSETVVPF